MANRATIAFVLLGFSLLGVSRGMCTSPRSKHCSFVDHFRGHAGNLWESADNYANGEPFNVWWSKHNVAWNHHTGRASLFLNNKRGPRFGKPFAGGHLKSKNYYGYGCYEVRVKPALQNGYAFRPTFTSR